MPIKAVIIDDEQDAIEVISSLLNTHARHIHLSGTASDVQSGCKLIRIKQPDIVFLDIKMPDGTGFDLLKKIPDIHFRIVFITAYEHYAVQAFRFSALDYLLKPINPDDFIRSIQNVKQVLEKEDLIVKLRTLEENLRYGSLSKKIIFKTSGCIYVKTLKDILFMNSDGSYTEVILLNGERIVLSKSLKEYEELLGTHRFLRIHKSHLINLEYLDKYIKGEGGSVLMKDGSVLPVAQRKREYLLKLLDKL